MTDPDPRTVGIVAVGDELLAGAHPDLNSPWIAARVQELGYRTRRVFVVGDDEDDIAAAVTRAAKDASLVFVSGGLGPTLDDVTRHGVARSVEAELEVDDAAWEEIQAFFARAGRETKPSNRRQALRPVGANVVPNAFGTAPGFRAQHPTGATVFVLPGPPREMQGVFAAEVEPWLAARPVDGRVRVKAIATFADLSESQFADAVGAWMERDANPLVGVTVKDGVLTARAVGSAATEPEARALAEARVADVAALFPDHHVGGDIGRGLGRFVGEELVRLGVTFTLAESCTGGLVAATVLDAPGLSAVLRNTWVTYANEAKVELLGVPSGVIERHGAVSAECAGAMAAGALERSGARVAVSVSGVAGPDGGTETKPVGLVWFGVARQGPGGTVVRTYERRWPPAGRGRIRHWAKNRALLLLLEEARAAAEEPLANHPSA